MGNCFNNDEDSSEDPKNAEKTEETINKPNGEEVIELPDKTKWKEDIVAIWKRNFSELPAHSDLPRLGRKIKLFDKDNNLILGPEQYEGLTSQKIVQLLIKTLCQHFEPELVEGVENRFDEFVKKEGDTSMQLLGFLNDVIKDDSKVSKILKLTHQKIIFPAFYRVKGMVYKTWPFKDQRGSWNVELHILENGIKVCHSKLQESKAGSKLY